VTRQQVGQIIRPGVVSTTFVLRLAVFINRIVTRLDFGVQVDLW
jgi:hypothetical protein